MTGQQHYPFRTGFETAIYRGVFVIFCYFQSKLVMGFLYNNNVIKGQWNLNKKYVFNVFNSRICYWIKKVVTIIRYNKFEDEEAKHNLKKE